MPESKWVYLHGGADVKERTVIERQDLSKSPAAILAARASLEAAGVSLSDIDLFDLYSCFPIAVFNICDGMGLAPDDARGLTMTGGLPFFGGAGNNYSMHAIASMVRALREKPGAKGFVGANGGFLSKYSVGVYSTQRADWKGFDSAPLQAEINGWDAPALAPGYVGEAMVETYTIDYSGKAPSGFVVARNGAGARVIAAVPAEDDALVRRLIAEEPLGGSVTTAQTEQGLTVVTGFKAG